MKGIPRDGVYANRVRWHDERGDLAGAKVISVRAPGADDVPPPGIFLVVMYHLDSVYVRVRLYGVVGFQNTQTWTLRLVDVEVVPGG